MGEIWNNFSNRSIFKKITLSTLKEIKKLNALDWSDRFIQGSELINGKIGDYAQINYFLFNNDDETGVNVGRSLFEISDLTLENEKDVIQLFWGACKEVDINGTQADMPIYTDTERAFDANPRICTYRNGSTTSISQFDELSWTNLLPKYYELLDSLDRTRFIECQLSLKRSDFINYNFKKTCIY